ncbi:hypothetical protein AB0P45_04750 [Streptomyces niveus]|uniref:hypothetical protein n=1 Tax=Streptomyces niveus TaxID=193462 RepID=UPI00342718D3
MSAEVAALLGYAPDGGIGPDTDFLEAAWTRWLATVLQEEFKRGGTDEHTEAVAANTPDTVPCLDRESASGLLRIDATGRRMAKGMDLLGAAAILPGSPPLPNSAASHRPYGCRAGPPPGAWSVCPHPWRWGAPTSTPASRHTSTTAGKVPSVPGFGRDEPLPLFFDAVLDVASRRGGASGGRRRALRPVGHLSAG